MRSSVLALALLLPLAAPAWADYDTGIAALETGDFKKAIAQLEPAATSGDIRAQYVLGILNAHGHGIKRDPEKAVAWLRKAAEGDFVAAQLELARIYQTGDGVPRDESATAKWYLRAAELGDVGAQLALADIYMLGRGVNKDLVAAYVWYEIASRYWGEMMDGPKQLLSEQLTDVQVKAAKKMADERALKIPH